MDVNSPRGTDPVQGVRYRGSLGMIGRKGRKIQDFLLVEACGGRKGSGSKSKGSKGVKSFVGKFVLRFPSPVRGILRAERGQMDLTLIFRTPDKETG